jgi:hypothetical protein
MDTSETGECMHALDLLGRRNSDDDPRGAGARSASRAVEVRLVLGRRVDVDHERDVVDMDASRGYVGGDEHARRPVREGGEVALTSGLGEVAVQLGGRDAGRREPRSERLGAVLCG